MTPEPTRALGTQHGRRGGVGFAAKARKWYDEEAKKRMREGGEKAGKGRPQQGKETLPYPIDKGQARDKAGKANANDSPPRRWDSLSCVNGPETP